MATPQNIRTLHSKVKRQSKSLSRLGESLFKEFNRVGDSLSRGLNDAQDNRGTRPLNPITSARSLQSVGNRRFKVARGQIDKANKLKESLHEALQKWSYQPKKGDSLEKQLKDQEDIAAAKAEILESIAVFDGNLRYAGSQYSDYLQQLARLDGMIDEFDSENPLDHHMKSKRGKGRSRMPKEKSITQAQLDRMMR